MTKASVEPEMCRSEWQLIWSCVHKPPPNPCSDTQVTRWPANPCPVCAVLWFGDGTIRCRMVWGWLTDPQRSTDPGWPPCWLQLPAPAHRPCHTQATSLTCCSANRSTPFFFCECVCVCMRACMCLQACVCVHAHVCVCMDACMSVYFPNTTCNTEEAVMKYTYL